METIAWSDFVRVEIRVGTNLSVEEFPKAQKPAYKLKADFGPAKGVKKSSPEITSLYSKEELIGTPGRWGGQLPPKQIGPFFSEFLVTEFYREDNAIVSAVPDKQAPNGARLG